MAEAGAVRRSVQAAPDEALRCVECGRASKPGESGWRAYLGGGYDIGELEIAIYCPDCASVEFRTVRGCLGAVGGTLWSASCGIGSLVD
jgi:hypothetical protein